MIERINRADRHASYRFDSLADMARYIETAPNTWGGQNESRHWRASTSWDLKAGYDAAWEMARWGWTDGAKQAKQALKAFALPATPMPVTKVGMAGHRPHVARYCAGAPDHMIAFDHKEGSRPILTLYVPVNAMADVDAEYMRNFGLGVAQYINTLEMSGTRVQAYAVMRSKLSGGWHVCHSVQIKRADQPLDLAVLSFAIGHPAMFRRLGFALRERCAAPRDEGYGRSNALELTDLINPEPGAVILNGMKDADRHARTPADALAYITDAIADAIK